MKNVSRLIPLLSGIVTLSDAIMHPKRTMGRIAKSLTLFIYLQMISALVI